MEENELDEDFDDDDDDDDDLEEFSLNDLPQLTNADQLTASGGIFIYEKSIASLAEIVAIAHKDKDGQNSPIAIEECAIAKAQIRSTHSDISIDESVFLEEVDFRNGVFEGKLSIWDTGFQKQADFHKAVFTKEVNFEDCTFAGQVSFAGAVFKKKVTFTSCSFKGEIVFDGAKFAAEVDLGESSFQKKVSFKDTVFEKTVDLTDVRFEETPETTGSNFAEMKKEPPPEPQPRKTKYHKRAKRKPQFNPWVELDRASKKSMSRRDLLRGVFRFLPKKEKQ